MGQESNKHKKLVTLPQALVLVCGQLPNLRDPHLLNDPMHATSGKLKPCLPACKSWSILMHGYNVTMDSLGEFYLGQKRLVISQDRKESKSVVSLLFVRDSGLIVANHWFPWCKIQALFCWIQQADCSDVPHTALVQDSCMQRQFILAWLIRRAFMIFLAIDLRLCCMQMLTSFGALSSMATLFMTQPWLWSSTNTLGTFLF